MVFVKEVGPAPVPGLEKAGFGASELLLESVFPDLLLLLE